LIARRFYGALPVAPLSWESAAAQLQQRSWAATSAALHPQSPSAEAPAHAWSSSRSPAAGLGPSPCGLVRASLSMQRMEPLAATATLSLPALAPLVLGWKPLHGTPSLHQRGARVAAWSACGQRPPERPEWWVRAGVDTQVEPRWEPAGRGRAVVALWACTEHGQCEKGERRRRLPSFWYRWR
jgi:hypothetical protein